MTKEEKRIIESEYGALTRGLDPEGFPILQFDTTIGIKPVPITKSEFYKATGSDLAKSVGDLLDFIGIDEFWDKYSKPIPHNFELKILPEYFEAQLNGTKQFEIRKDNNKHKFRVGDILTLNEFENGHYNGKIIKVKITYITDYEQKPGYVVLGTRRLREDER